MGRALPGIELTVREGELVADPRTVPTFFLGYLGEQVRRGETRRLGDRGPRASGAVAHGRPGAPKTRTAICCFEGRTDDVIISAGYRIGPFEVESALVAHPAVAEAAAVAAPDEERGSVVRAVVVLRDGLRALAGAGARAAGARQARDGPLQVPAHRRVRASCRRPPAARSGAARGTRSADAAASAARRSRRSRPARPVGSAATPTATRAGGSSPKNESYTSLTSAKADRSVM